MKPTAWGWGRGLLRWAQGWAVVGGLAMGLAVQAQETITWGLPHFPPFSIQTGVNKNQGLTDYVRTLLQHQMLDVVHLEVEAPIPRITRELKAGEPWCWVGAIKTPERERFAEFSVPFGLFLPQQMVVHVRHQAQLEALARTPQGGLSLARLLSHQAMRTAILRGRSYGDVIDNLLAQHPELPAYSSVPEALQMLLADRIDFVIEYPAVAHFYAYEQKRARELVALSFEEMADIVPGYIACPKTAWGKQAIARINQVLRTQRGRPAYRAQVERWNPPEAVATIRRRYDEFLGH